MYSIVPTSCTSCTYSSCPFIQSLASGLSPRPHPDAYAFAVISFRIPTYILSLCEFVLLTSVDKSYSCSQVCLNQVSGYRRCYRSPPDEGLYALTLGDQLVSSLDSYLRSFIELHIICWISGICIGSSTFGVEVYIYFSTYMLQLFELLSSEGSLCLASWCNAEFILGICVCDYM